MRLRRTAPQPGEPGDQPARTHPAVAPSFYERFPSDFQVIFGSSITSTVIVVFVLNLVFNHWSWRQPKRDDAIDEALSHGAVAVDVPDGGVHPHGGDGQPTG